MIRVLIADDHVIMRNGLKQLCEVMRDISVAGEAANGDEVMAALSESQFDLILLDLTMPGVSDVDLIKHIRAQYPELPILIFSMRNELQVARRVLKAGASGFITKGGQQDILVSAIRNVAAGKRFVDPMIVEQMLLETCVSGETARRERLSRREQQIMQLLAQGKSLNAIAEELFISSKTVSTHKMRLMQKMNFKSNAELVLYAAESGFVQK